jgi:hypothetical protein
VDLGKRLSVSEEQVLRMNIAGGLYYGGPQCETWTFDTERVAVLERQWAEVQAGVRERVNFTREPEVDTVRKLSPGALALLRLFKQAGMVYPYPETFKWMKELEAAGWIRLNATSLYFDAVPQLKAVSLPRGATARFVAEGLEAIPA